MMPNRIQDEYQNHSTVAVLVICCRDESANEKAADEYAGKDRQEVTDVHGHDGQHAASQNNQSPSQQADQ